MKYCIYCGNKLEDEQKFCSNCGAKQEDNTISEEIIEEKVEEIKEEVKPKKFAKVFSVLSFIFGIVCLIMSFIPIVGLYFVELSIPGLIFGIIAKANKVKGAKPILGIIFNAISFLICIIVLVIFIEYGIDGEWENNGITFM